MKNIIYLSFVLIMWIKTICVLQGLTLNYSRTEAIRTKTIIRNVLIRVIQADVRKKTDWNVELVMEEAGHSTRDESRPLRRTYRSRITKSAML
jgi:hypothetical protein